MPFSVSGRTLEWTNSRCQLESRPIFLDVYGSPEGLFVLRFAGAGDMRGDHSFQEGTCYPGPEA